MCLKMRIFWRKAVKIAAASCVLLSKKNKCNNCRCSAFASSALLRLFFTSNSAVFLMWVQNYFLLQGAGQARNQKLSTGGAFFYRKGQNFSFTAKTFASFSSVSCSLGYSLPTDSKYALN